jgi:hypothetical protein
VVFEIAEAVAVSEGDVKDADEESGEEDGARGGKDLFCAGGLRDGANGRQSVFLAVMWLF